jgi:hypothetical protein
VGDRECNRAESLSGVRSVSWNRIGTISGVSCDSCGMEACRATKLSQWTTTIADRARASQGDDDGITRSAISADPWCDLGCWTLLVAAACSFVRDGGPCRSSHVLRSLAIYRAVT